MTTQTAVSIWHIYLIRTAGDVLYTGITTDVARRITQHQQGRGAKALRGKGPLNLAFSAAAGSHGDALRLEYRIKQLSKRQKEKLIAERPADIAGWLATHTLTG